MIEKDSADTCNAAVTIVSLLMMRMHLFAINSRTASWRVHAAVMVFIFPFFRKQRESSYYATKETKYDAQNNFFADFNVYQPEQIFDKTKIHFDAIYSSGLDIARDNCTLKGYLSTFHEFVESLKDAASTPPPSRPVHVNEIGMAVDQLWNEVRGVVEAADTWMKCFITSFGVEGGNGMSPLVSAKYNSPKDL